MWGAFSSHKRLFNPLPRFSRLGTQCPALMSCHVYLYLCVLYGYFGICGIYLPGMNFMLLSTNGVYEWHTRQQYRDCVMCSMLHVSYPYIVSHSFYTILFVQIRRIFNLLVLITSDTHCSLLYAFPSFILPCFTIPSSFPPSPLLLPSSVPFPLL